MQWCWSWWYNGEDYGDYAGDDGKDYKEWRHRVKICFAFIKVGLVGVFLNGLVIIGVRTNRSSSTWSWWCHHHRHKDGHQDDDDDHYIGSGSLTRRSTTCYSGFARPPCLRQPSGFLQSASFLVTSHLSAFFLTFMIRRGYLQCDYKASDHRGLQNTSHRTLFLCIHQSGHR